jgi:hypothetical protein
MAWECQSVSECECSANSVRSKQRGSLLKGLLVQPNDTPNLVSNEHDTYVWKGNIVPTYTTLDFTFRSDRLLAIAGLATAIGRFRKDTYVAGIWTGSMKDILWYNTSAKAGTKTGIENVPTWSWAAVDSEIAFINVQDRRRFQKRLVLQLRNVVENPSQYGAPAYRPTLLVTGLLILVHIVGPIRINHLNISHAVSITSQQGGYGMTAIYDSACPFETDGLHYLLLMTTSSTGPVGMLLVKTKGNRDCFERVWLVLDTSQVSTRVWSGANSVWGGRDPREKLEATTREKNWKKLKRIARM